MGSVKHKSLTGDNDLPVFPEEITTHYYYCDNCGSFEIEDWTIPANTIERSSVRKRLKTILFGMIMVAIISLMLLKVLFLILASFLALIALYILATAYPESKYLGVKCATCGEEYENGSEFLSNYNDNSRNYTMDDVPRPLNRNYSRNY